MRARGPLASALILMGCGGGGGGPAPAAPKAAADAGLGPAADAGAGTAADGLASLDALSARGPTDAPLMRELLRVERAAPRSPDVLAPRDLCVRALFAASGPVRAWFSDAGGAPRGEVTTATSGAVPPRGPACARKGESLHLVIESDASAAARAVIFAAP